MSGHPAAGIVPATAGPGDVAEGAVPHRGRSGVPAGTWCWFAAAISLIFAKNVMASRDLTVDSYYDLYAGRYVVQHGLPHSNVFTVAAHGAPWVDQQWLGQAIYYAAWSAGGYPALAVLSAALVTSGFALLALLMIRRAVPPTRTFAWTALAFLACLGNDAVRVQSFAYPLLVLTLWLVLDDRRHLRPAGRVWLSVPLLVFWANVHGSVLLGAALVAGYAMWRSIDASRRRDAGSALRYLGLGAAAALSVACTPYGTAVIGYYRSVAGNRELASVVAEWAAPNPLSPQSWGFTALIVLVAAAMIVAGRRGTRPDPLLATVTLALLALALTGVRFQAWFALGASLLAADTLARARRHPVPALAVPFRLVTAAALAALAAASLVVVLLTPASRFESGVPARAIGVAAQIAARHPGMTILGDDWSGSPMLWLDPAAVGRVGFDARLEQYSPAQITSFYGFVNVAGPRWWRVTKGYGLIVISRLQHPTLADALARLPGWRVVYRDRMGLVLERGH